MKIFISGGCKNGKSYYAQHLAKAQQKKQLYYIATMKPADKEDGERITKHRNEREGWGFVTVEQGTDIEGILQKCDADGSFLLDSVTALLANEMFRPPDWEADELAPKKIIAGLSEVFFAVRDIVVVSDYIYSDAALYDGQTEKYRRALAEIDRMAAKACDVVLEVAYTNVIAHKGGKYFGEIGEIHEKIL